MAQPLPPSLRIQEDNAHKLTLLAHKLNTYGIIFGIGQNSFRNLLLSLAYITPNTHMVVSKIKTLSPAEIKQ